MIMCVWRFVFLALAMCAILSAGCTAQAEEPPEPETVRGWARHLDGGGTISITPVENAPAEVTDAVRLEYLGDPPGWANAGCPIEIDARAVSLEFHLRKIAVGPAAQLHVLVMEPDGDIWVRRMFGVGLEDVGEGWRKVTAPISGFRHWGRGDGVRSIVGSGTLLVGCARDRMEIEVGGVNVVIAEGARNRN